MFLKKNPSMWGYIFGETKEKKISKKKAPIKSKEKAINLKKELFAIRKELSEIKKLLQSCTKDIVTVANQKEIIFEGNRIINGKDDKDDMVVNAKKKLYEAQILCSKNSLYDIVNKKK